MLGAAVPSVAFLYPYIGTPALMAFLSSLIWPIGAVLFQFPITALREIKMLQKLKHQNVTELVEICSSKGDIFSALQILLMSSLA